MPSIFNPTTLFDGVRITLKETDSFSVTWDGDELFVLDKDGKGWGDRCMSGHPGITMMVNGYPLSTRTSRYVHVPVHARIQLVFHSDGVRYSIVGDVSYTKKVRDGAVIALARVRAGIHNSTIMYSRAAKRLFSVDGFEFFAQGVNVCGSGWLDAGLAASIIETIAAGAALVEPYSYAEQQVVQALGTIKRTVSSTAIRIFNDAYGDEENEPENA